MVPSRYLLAVLAAVSASGCIYVLDREAKQNDGLECSSPRDCVGSALPCDTHDPAKCGCGTFKRCETGVCSWVSIDCISTPDAGGGGSTGACLKSADCEGVEKTCDALNTAACGCGEFKRCESGRCTRFANDCPAFDAGTGPGQCSKSADCPGDAKPCDFRDPALCGCGTFKWCQSGRCVGLSVDCFPGADAGSGLVKCMKAAECPGSEPVCDSADLAACGCGAFRVCERGYCSTAKVACPPVCKYGYDQTCNDDPWVSSLEGVCRADGSCACRAGTQVNPATGRCRLDSKTPDAGSGPVKCMKAAECPGSEPVCDFADLAACGCGAFRVCERGYCSTAKVACPPVCKVGYDQTCNDDLEVSSIEGVCRADGTCACRAGTQVNPATGRCRLDSKAPDAGSGLDAGECVKSTDCPSEAPACEATSAACAYGKCKSCQAGRCVWSPPDCSIPDAGVCRGPDVGP